jgi:hypothetical protein
MNFELIEGRETGYKVVKFGGVRIADEKIVHYKRESGGVGRAWGWRFRSSRVG